MIDARSPTLPRIAGGAQALPALLEHEAADRACVVLGPDHEDVGDRAVADPHFRTAEAVATCNLARARDQPTRVGTMVRLGQAEAADPFAAGELGQVLLPRRLIAKLIDGGHHQRRLNAHHRAVAGIDALDFARDQPIADAVQT